uniref:Uncharacterized protein n=1 Tax=Arundo donax TaxID=35708 RepID=A0A0A9BMC7_ARUDO
MKAYASIQFSDAVT